MKQSFKARTTGKVKRTIKKAVIPGYGKKGSGWIKNPKKAAYNKAYAKTTKRLFPSFFRLGKTSKKKNSKQAATADYNILETNAPVELSYNPVEENTEPVMKICKYCGQINKDNETKCSSCAANEFSYRCSNCGTLFDTGNYCPTCGVKIGTKAKTCPSCGTEFFTNACPNCGYNNISNKNTSYAGNSSQKRKRSKTWLWVLGWIFIFPLPLTILLSRKKDMNPVIKFIIIAVAWLLYFALAFLGARNNNSNLTTEVKTHSVEFLFI